MGNDLTTARSKASSFHGELRFAVLLAVVAAGLIAILLLNRPNGLELGRPLKTIAQAVDSRQRRHQAQALRAACRHEDCGCVEVAAGAGLDVDAGRAVLELLSAGKACQFPALPGMRTEAQVRAQSVNVDAQQAEVLREKNRDAHVMAAMGLAAYRRGAPDLAAALLDQAVAAGAGDGARAVLGLVRYSQNDLVGARAAFEAILANEPEDLEAAYNLALVAQKQDRYGEARRLYLTVLRASPKHLQARYNLAILAHSIGADQEAKHHLELLGKAAPTDPLVATLREALAQPTKRAGQVLTLGAQPASSAR